MRRVLSRLLPVAFALAFAAHADAAPVNVTAQVAKACRVSSTVDVTIASYDPTLDTPTIGTGSVAVRCTKGVTYQWEIDGGKASSVTAVRQMSNVGDPVPLLYTLSGTSALQAKVAAVPGTAYPGGASASPATEMTLSLEASLAPYQDVTLTGGTDYYSDTVEVTVTVAP